MKLCQKSSTYLSNETTASSYIFHCLRFFQIKKNVCEGIEIIEIIKNGRLHGEIKIRIFD